MARGNNQKLKLLYIYKILSEKTDENHCMSAQQLIEALDELEISAERKSIYDDIECLNKFGYEILCNKSRVNGGYYLAKRDFELAELKLLVDAVQSSRYITIRKSRELIKKLETLGSSFDAKMLQRQVFVSGRIKTDNECIYYNVDSIHNAMLKDLQITFTYLEWNEKKELQPKNEGKRYQVSPWALTCKDENYYLLAYDDKDCIIKHFRVDKMNRILELGKMRRKGNDIFQQFDVAGYTNRSFGMFNGQTEAVTLDIPPHMIGVFIDRFGKDNLSVIQREQILHVRMQVTVSNQFYGWITGLGPNIRIVSPERIRREYRDYLSEILRGYC